MFISWMLIMPSLKKCLMVKQFQGITLINHALNNLGWAITDFPHGLGFLVIST